MFQKLITMNFFRKKSELLTREEFPFIQLPPRYVEVPNSIIHKRFETGVILYVAFDLQL